MMALEIFSRDQVVVLSLGREPLGPEFVGVGGYYDEEAAKQGRLFQVCGQYLLSAGVPLSQFGDQYGDQSFGVGNMVFDGSAVSKDWFRRKYLSGNEKLDHLERADKENLAKLKRRGRELAGGTWSDLWDRFLALFSEGYRRKLAERKVDWDQKAPVIAAGIYALRVTNQLPREFRQALQKAG